jgi:hypothetical protein
MVSSQEVERPQRAFCSEREVPFVATPGMSITGFARSTTGKLPANGLRHPLTSDTNGWYIWFGEDLNSKPDFFDPVHAEHIYGGHPELIRLLGLPPGYRFLLAGNYLDVWYDESILKVTNKE